MKSIGKKGCLLPLIGCLISLAVFLLEVPSIFGYELKLYHPIVVAMLMALTSTASCAGVMLRKKKLSGAGVLFAWMMPFLAALSMTGWPRIGGVTGTVCGAWCLLLSQAAFWRCVESKRLRTAAACTVIGLIAAGILTALLTSVFEIWYDVLFGIMLGAMFAGSYLLTGTLIALCSIAEKRWSKNLTGIFVPLAAFGLMGVLILTHIVFGPGEYDIVQSIESPDGRLVAEEYSTDAGNRIRVREDDGQHILIGRICRKPYYVSYPYQSAAVGTLAWLDEDTLLINGDAWPWRQFAD